jgi:hypothetical protein
MFWNLLAVMVAQGVSVLKSLNFKLQNGKKKKEFF